MATLLDAARPRVGALGAIDRRRSSRELIPTVRITRPPWQVQGEGFGLRAVDVGEAVYAGQISGGEDSYLVIPRWPTIEAGLALPAPRILD
jgi:hypothetical protein